MKEFGDEQSQVRDRKPQPARPAKPLPPLFASEPPPGRSRYVTYAMIAAAILGALGLLGYETLLAPDDAAPWSPPKGLSVEDTPDWLQVLCADRTRQLCTAADRARTAEDCDKMRAALGALDKLDRKLSAEGTLSARQHWVLIELYEQGNELCQFERPK